ncbi:MAG TPA: DNA-processing protein DprA [Marinobacter sp.]|nr:DNA-processing protein DprA [Marinobacter sp.]
MPDVDTLRSTTGQWLVLSLLPRFGTVLQSRLLEHHPYLPDVLALNAATLKALGVTPEAREAIQAWQSGDTGHPGIQTALMIVDACKRHNITLLGRNHEHFPEALRHIHGAPLLLYALGDTSRLLKDQIGIVGSRNASPAGLDHARKFAAELSRRGLLTTSGLALGIDGAAHAGALDAGFATIAVVGCGLDRLYPTQHRKLAARIVDNGVIVSEYPPGTQARAAHFPQRNRIISGLSRGVLVVEASLRSGSLITARLALEQGREVFAIPGSVHSPVARGCHQLIKQGARLVETVEDVLEELGTWWTLQADTETSAPESLGDAALADSLNDLPAREIAVFRALGYDPQSTDALSQATGLPADQLMQSLLELELQGLIHAAPGGYLRTA